MRGYWKLWHDVSARFLVACVVVGWQLYATAHGVGANHVFGLGPYARPAVCRPALVNDVSTAERAARLHLQAENESSGNNRFYHIAEHNYNVLARYCGANQRPTENYPQLVTNWTTAYVDSVWGAMMPLLMLFMGVLISVGPPFSGESSEASALTFSLPWSRGRWLSEKVAMSVGLLAVLVLPAYAVGHAMTSFDPIPRMYGTMFIEPMHFLDIMPSVVCGIVGVALGISATMMTRNALIGAVCGALAAYGLAMFNVYSLFPSMRYTGEHMTVLDLGTTTGMYVALTVIIGAIGLSYVRLTRTDF